MLRLQRDHACDEINIKPAGMGYIYYYQYKLQGLLLIVVVISLSVWVVRSLASLISFGSDLVVRRGLGAPTASMIG